jgi:hypothetical protein
MSIATAMETTAPSPFLPGTNIQYAWDSTSLNYLKRCPRLYEYIMIEGWQPRGENIHIRFGIELHKTLQDYEVYREEGHDHHRALCIVVWSLLTRIWEWEPEPTSKSETLKSKRNLVRAVIWYLDKFSRETDPAKTYILQSGKPAVEVSFRFELDWGPTEDQPYLLCGHLDKVVNFNGDLFVMDHKTTTTTISDFYFDQFDPDNQMSLYSLAAQVVISSPVKGVIIDAIQVAEGFIRPVRSFTFRNDQRTEEWLNDLAYWLRQAEEFALQGYWPQNDTACDKYGGCKFRDVCRKAPHVREQFLKGNFVRGPGWNPLILR